MIRVYDGSQKYDSICNRISYLSVKSGIACIASYNYAKIKVNSYHSIPLEKQWLFMKL